MCESEAKRCWERSLSYSSQKTLESNKSARGNLVVAFYQFQEDYVSPSRVTLSTRISTYDQHTLPIQIDAMHEFATRRGWMVIDTVEEMGSAAKNDCPKRQALLAAAKQRKLEIILNQSA